MLFKKKTKTETIIPLNMFISVKEQDSWNKVLSKINEYNEQSYLEN